VRPYAGGATCELVALHRTLARLAGEVPPGVSVDGQNEIQPIPYRAIEAWEAWWDRHRAQWPEPYRVRFPDPAPKTR
jgi:hypothetical protein